MTHDDLTIDKCRDKFATARKPAEIEAWALRYGLWLMDLAEDGLRMGEQPEPDIVLPEPDGDGDYRFADDSWIFKAPDPPYKYHTNQTVGDMVYYDTPHAAARALSALGKGPGAHNRNGEKP